MTFEIQWWIDNKLTHQIHTSERRAFRACRRRWDWAYREMYSPFVQAEPLEFGVAFHKAMEIFYEPRTWLSQLEVKLALAKVAFRRECEAHMAKYMKIQPDPDVEILKSYKDRIDFGLKMIEYYCGTVSPQYDQRWTPIRVEVGFEVPVEDNDKQLWCKCDRCWIKFVNWQRTQYPDPVIDGGGLPQASHPDQIINKSEWKGLPVTYAGRLDMLAQDEHGRYWVVDWKTTSRLLDEDAEASFLQLDDQILSYVWALSKYGINVAGFVYVEIKKTFPSPPDRLKRPYKGRSFSTDKQHFTTYDIFLNTVQEHDNSAWQMGFYDDYLNWLKSDGPKFTQRHQIHKNQHEIDQAGKTIALEAIDMIDDPSVYPMPGRFSCNWCLFKQPCLGVNMGEDFQYTLDTMFEKKTMMYWEQKEASTE